MKTFKDESKQKALMKQVQDLKSVLQAELELIKAEKLFQGAIFNSEELDMEDCTSALDCVNHAVKLTFERDTEVEAQCEAFAGKIYYKGLVNLIKAKFHLTNCVKLSQLLKPKDVSQEAWYLKASKLLQEIRDKL